MMTRKPIHAARKEADRMIAENAPDPIAATTPDSAVADIIRTAVALLAAGKPIFAVAKSLGTDTEVLFGYRYDHCDFWERELVLAQSCLTPGAFATGHQDLICLAVALVAQGKSINQAARDLRVPERRMHKLKATWKQTWNRELSIARSQVAASRIEILTPPHKETLAKIRQATAMAAAGIYFVDIAKTMGVELGTVDHWRDSYPEIWNQEYDRAMEAAAVVIRSQAGTATVSNDPERFMRAGLEFQAWARCKGREIFPRTEEPTLYSFFEDYYVPVRMNDAQPITIVTYRSTMNLWTLFTGNPPLREITAETLAMFKGCIEKTLGKDRIHYISVHTVRKHLRTIQCILDKAGPRKPRNRDAKGILTEIPPWIKPPRAEDPEPRAIPLEVLDCVYDSCASMDWPWIPGVKPPQLWKALLAIAYNTSLRRRSLFELRWDEVDLPGRRLLLPPKRLKQRKRQVVPLNTVAYDHLIGIRTDRELVFPFPGSPGMFNRHFYALQAIAGIPIKERFGLQEIRQTSATILWEDSPQAAQYALGHSRAQVTRRFYVAGNGLVARARETMPQPKSFRRLPVISSEISERGAALARALNAAGVTSDEAKSLLMGEIQPVIPIAAGNGPTAAAVVPPGLKG
jgi:integrase